MSAHLTYLNELLNAFLSFQITKAFEAEMLELLHYSLTR